MTMDLRTPTEKARQERDAKLCADYKELRESNPTCSDNRIFGALAEDNGLTIMGIKGIIKRNGAYIPRQ